jgi:hypothetical protein
MVEEAGWSRRQDGRGGRMGEEATGVSQRSLCRLYISLVQLGFYVCMVVALVLDGLTLDVSDRQIKLTRS